MTYRLFRFAQGAIRRINSNGGGACIRHQHKYQYQYRHLCVAPNKKATDESKPSNRAAPAEESKPVTASVSVTSGEVAREKEVFIPNIYSSSLGLESPDDDDPKKWQKFGWKYLGSIVVFVIAYTGIGWYADEMEKERKRLAGNDDTPTTTTTSGGSQETQQQQQRGITDAAAATAVAVAQPTDEIAGFISELDELKKYRAELVAALDSAESDERRNELREEIGELRAEIDLLER